MTDDNLTRDEAADRATKVSRVSYEISLDLTTGEETFTSETTVRFWAPLVGLTTFIDLDAPNVKELSLNGRTIPIDSYDAAKSRIPLRGLLATNEVKVVAECAYQHTGVGLHRFVDPTDGNAYLHTQFEPYDAHRVFACFDQPDIKATFALTVTAPADWTVVSNNPVADHDQAAGIWRFEPTPELSPYLAALVAGPYHSVHDSHNNVDMAIYCRKSLAPHLDAEEIFTITRQGLDFYEAEFEYRYPFAKYDQLFVPEFNFGAMENPGCITFNEGMIFRSRVTDAAHENRAGTILHEMAHMWFGDLVTMGWWDDLWLNESFATYMGTEGVARATRFSDAWVRFASGTKGWALVQDQLPSTHPISADIVDTDSVRLHFDGITYAKGASVLRQLVAWVGPDAFRDGCRRYFQDHEWGNATLADFLGVLEETSGRDLGPWAAEWLQTAGVNTIRAQFSVDTATGNYSHFSLGQEAVAAYPTLRSHRLAIGLYRAEGLGSEARLVCDRRVELDVAGASTDVPVLVGQAAVDLVLVNDGDLAYTKVRLDERSLATLADHLSRIVDPMARNLCWASTWDMVRDGELPTRRFVELVRTHAGEEPDDSTLSRLLGQATLAVEAYGDPSNRLPALGALAVDARVGLGAAAAGSDRQLIWARHFLGAATTSEDLDFARSLLDATEEIPGLAIDTDLRWQIVATLAAAGADQEADLIDAELKRDPTDIGNRRAASARASRPTPDAKTVAWKALDSPGLHLAVLRSTAGAFWRYGQDKLLEPYVEVYFSALHRWWDERSPDEVISLANGLFPRTLVRPEVVADVDNSLTDASLPGPLQRILTEGKDGMERALRARAVDTGPDLA